MRVLLTGAGGFLARHLLRHMATRGPRPDRIVLLDLPGRLPDPELTEGLSTVPVEVDLADPSSAGRTIAPHAGPDIAIHLAAVLTGRNRPDIQARNTRMLRNLLPYLEGAGLLLASSSAVYGAPESDDALVDETHPLSPLTAYGTGCMEREELALSRREPTTALRIFNMIGPGQQGTMLAPSLALRLAQIETGRREPLLRTGPLHTLRDYVDVRDVAAALALLLESGPPPTLRTVNVATGSLHSGREILQRLLELSSAAPEVRESGPPAPSSKTVRAIAGDSALLRRETGWRPLVPLRRSLEDLMDAARREVAEAERRSGGSDRE